MLRPVAHQLRASVVVGLAVGIAVGVVGYAAGGWPAAAGVAGGLGVMLAATAAAAVQAGAVVGGWGARRMRLVGSLASLASLAVALGCFWWLVNCVGAPGWSLAGGVTAVVVGLVCGFALRANRFAG